MTPFSGATYREDRDESRLRNQLERIRDLMLDGVWRTVAEIHDVTGFPEASISAQLRNLRKPKLGGYRVERRWRGGDVRQLSEYRVCAPVKTGQMEMF